MTLICCACGFESVLQEDYASWHESEDTVDFYPVTSNGKPGGSVIAWMCARCLGKANQMRIHVKSMLSGVRVSKHAVDRFLERQVGEPISEDAAISSILKQFDRAKQIIFKEKHMVQRFLNHGKPADYFFHAGSIFVTTQEKPRTILTVERQWHRRLGQDFWYANGKSLTTV